MDITKGNIEPKVLFVGISTIEAGKDYYTAIDLNKSENKIRYNVIKNINKSKTNVQIDINNIIDM